MDMIYNAHSIMKDYYTFDMLYNMPIRDVIRLVEYFTPKIKEIARQQENDRLNAELAGKSNQRKPGR